MVTFVIAADRRASVLLLFDMHPTEHLLRLAAIEEAVVPTHVALDGNGRPPFLDEFCCRLLAVRDWRNDIEDLMLSQPNQSSVSSANARALTPTKSPAVIAARNARDAAVGFTQLHNQRASSSSSLAGNSFKSDNSVQRNDTILMSG